MWFHNWEINRIKHKNNDTQQVGVLKLFASHAKASFGKVFKYNVHKNEFTCLKYKFVYTSWTSLFNTSPNNGKIISWNVDSSNILVPYLIRLLYYEHWTDKWKCFKVCLFVFLLVFFFSFISCLLFCFVFTVSIDGFFRYADYWQLKIPTESKLLEAATRNVL